MKKVWASLPLKTTSRQYRCLFRQAAHIGFMGLLALSFMGMSSQASADIYVCRSSKAKDIPEYTNEPTAQKNCQLLDLQANVTIPYTQVHSASSASSSASIAPLEEKNFPRIDVSTQRTRDQARQKILQNELRLEQKKFAELQKASQIASQMPTNSASRSQAASAEQNNKVNTLSGSTSSTIDSALQEKLARSQSNIAALQRELDRLRP